MVPSATAELALSSRAASPLNPNVVRLHDARIKGLDVPGLDYYTTRGVVLPGAVVIGDGLLPPGYTGYLREVGIGSTAILETGPGPTLFEGLTDANCRMIEHFFRLGMSVELFIPTPEQTEFIDRLARVVGDSYASLAISPNPEIAADTNDKIIQRRIDPHGYPEHYLHYVTNVAGVTAAVRDLLAGYESVFVKHPTLASGNGIHQIGTNPDRLWETELAETLADFAARGYTGEVIIEAGYPRHVPLSVQAYIHKDGRAEILANTVQQMLNGTVHAGNFIGSGELPGIPAGLTQRMEALVWPTLTRLAAAGYVGYLGIDLIYAPDDDQLFKVEINARVTGAMYPLSVAQQVLVNHPDITGWGIASEKFKCQPGISFTEITRLLDGFGLLFDGRTGVLPIAPGLTSVGVFAGYAVSGSVEDGENLLKEAALLLGPS